MQLVSVNRSAAPRSRAARRGRRWAAVRSATASLRGADGPSLPGPPPARAAAGR